MIKEAMMIAVAKTPVTTESCQQPDGPASGPLGESVSAVWVAFPVYALLVVVASGGVEPSTFVVRATRVFVLSRSVTRIEGMRADLSQADV
jgi:hypothetical protein